MTQEIASPDVDALERRLSTRDKGEHITVFKPDLRAILKRLRAAESANENNLSGWMNDRAGWSAKELRLEALIAQLEEVLREISERPGDPDNWLVARNALANLEEK